MLSLVQMNNVTTEYCLDIIRKFEVSEENKTQNVLGIEGNIFQIFSLFKLPVMQKIFSLVGFKYESTSY